MFSHLKEKPIECKMHVKISLGFVNSSTGTIECVPTESREYEDMMNILTSSYIDTGSLGCFTYSKPRLINSELLEKEVRDR